MADRRSGKNTHTHLSLGSHKWQIAGQGKIHIHLSLPTGPHKWQIAGQGKIHIHTYPCLQDRTNGRSPVREKYTYTPIPAYRTAQMADRRSGKNTHTHLSLPTGPHKWQIAGQGKIHTHTYPCLQDRTNGRSPVREKYTYTPIPVYRTAQMADRRSGENIHTHLSLPTGPHKWQIAGQGEIHTLVTMSCCCRHALYTYTCTLYLRVPRTVGSHFSFLQKQRQWQA